MIGLMAAVAAFVLLPGSGHALAPCIPSVPYLSLDMESIDFGSWDFGATSDAETVTITNISGCSITNGIGGITSDYDVFNNDGGCDSQTLANNASCTVSFTFVPVENDEAVSNFSGIYNLPFSSGSLAIALSGSGPNDNSSNDSSGCDATASTGMTGKKAFGPAAMGLFAMLGLVIGTAAIRRRMRKHD